VLAVFAENADTNVPVCLTLTTLALCAVHGIDFADANLAIITHLFEVCHLAPRVGITQVVTMVRPQRYNRVFLVSVPSVLTIGKWPTYNLGYQLDRKPNNCFEQGTQS
jgi:hypothetical protein